MSKKRERRGSFLISDRGQKKNFNAVKKIPSFSSGKVFEACFERKIRLNLNWKVFKHLQRIYLDDIAVAYLDNCSSVDKIVCRRVNILVLGYQRPEVIGTVFALQVKGSVSHFPNLDVEEMHVGK